MVGLFKTCFYFSGKTYLAIVSIMEYRKLKTISFFLPDTSLHSILPYGQLTFEVREGVRISERGLEKAEALITSVLSAIETCDLPQTKRKEVAAPTPVSWPEKRAAVLQLFMQGELKDSCDLPADFEKAGEKGEKWHLQNAMAQLLDKWKTLWKPGTYQPEFRLVWLRNEKEGT